MGLLVIIYLEIILLMISTKYMDSHLGTYIDTLSDIGLSVSPPPAHYWQ